jgi:periplasmic protein TonB
LGFRLPAPAAYAVSAALHAAAFAGLLRVPALAFVAPDEVAVEVIEAPPPQPPEPPPRAAAPRLPPPPRKAPLAPPRDAPPPPAPVPEAPPPPNAPPPEDAPPVAQAPVRIGISISSATSAGGVAAPVGNTGYGEMPRTAPDPGEVKPYRSDKYVPPAQVTVRPRLIGDSRLPSEDYPEEALRLEVEGLVVLVLTIDEKGAVTDARVVEDPGHGLGAAAAASVRRRWRFEPARKDGEPVATTWRVKVRFVLP